MPFPDANLRGLVKNPVFLDLETTGLQKSDEVLEIALADADGRPLVNSLVRPLTRASWPEAQAVHGIRPADVADAPRLSDLLSEIAQAVQGKDLVIYNAAFDAPFLLRNGGGEALSAAAAIWCCMERYAAHAGQWEPARGGYRWHKLKVAAEAAGFRFGHDNTAHRALADVRATCAVWAWLDACGAPLTAAYVLPPDAPPPEKTAPLPEGTDLAALIDPSQTGLVEPDSGPSETGSGREEPGNRVQQLPGLFDALEPATGSSDTGPPPGNPASDESPDLAALIDP